MAALFEIVPVGEPALLSGLHRDHANTATLLKLLDSEADVLLRDESPDYGVLLDIMEYFVTYPDQYHHRNEDQLFERLLASEVDVDANVHTLMAQHRQLARAGRSIIDTINSIIGGSMIPRADIHGELTGYTWLLREHMRLEDGTVFPSAEERLVDADWMDPDSALVERNDPLFGDIVSHRFQALAERL